MRVCSSCSRSESCATLDSADSPTPESTQDANGVDREQIRQMLRLKPAARLSRMEEFVESMLEIRRLNAVRTIR